MALLTACGNTKQPAAQEHPPQTGSNSILPAVKAPGKVTISFDYQRMRVRASDQLAVWIEDAQGNHVRTLLVTKFTANGGYQKRAQSVPNWQKSFQPAAASPEVLDAVSSATPPSGPVSVVWDCLNQAGNAVAAGTYVYKVESNIEWEKIALWQGTITIGPTAGQSTATSATSDNTLLQAVRADFRPTS